MNREGADLRVRLYRSWCHSAGAVLSLCLLSQACLGPAGAAMQDWAADALCCNSACQQRLMCQITKVMSCIANADHLLMRLTR